MFAAVMCLSLVVYLRDDTERPHLPLSMPLAVPNSGASLKASPPTTQPAKRPVRKSTDPLPVARLVHFHATNDDHLCIGEIPSEAQELATVLQRLHATTVEAFEQPPLATGGSIGRHYGGFGGQMASHARYANERWDPREVTSRGFVFNSGGAKFTGVPESRSAKSINQITADPSAKINPQEKVWSIVDIHLVDLQTHEQPVVHEYVSKTRAPDLFETEALKNLRAGAERVMAWNDDLDGLQVIGAIRAKESCAKCHDVKVGQLVGAFSYRIAGGSRGQ